MKKLTLILCGGIVLLAGALSVVTAEEAKKSAALDGKALFLDQKCESCHSVTALKIEKKASATPASKDAKVPPDLSAIGTKAKPEFLMNYLKKIADLNGAKHMKKFRGNDDSLKVLVDWLMSLKATEKSAGSK